MTVAATPISIEATEIPESFFTFPKDQYTLEVPESEEDMMAAADSMVKAAAIEKVPSKKAPAKKAPVKKAPVKKAPVKKSTAIKKQ